MRANVILCVAQTAFGKENKDRWSECFVLLRMHSVCEQVETASVIRVWVHAFLEFVQLIHDMVLGDGKR